MVLTLTYMTYCLYIWSITLSTSLTGIFSDVHMLGLMYAGEMCYWFWQESTKMTSPEPSSDGPSSKPSNEIWYEKM